MAADEPEVDQAERGRHQAGGGRSHDGGERAQRRPEHHPRRGRRRDPAQCLGALFGDDGVADVGLDDAGRRAARALDQPREVEQPDQNQRRDPRRRPLRARQGEDQVGDEGDRDAEHQHRPPPAPVGELAPQRRGGELGDGVDRHHQADLERRGTEVLGVDRQHRHDHQEADHVDEDGEHQRPEASEGDRRGGHAVSARARRGGRRRPRAPSAARRRRRRRRSPGARGWTGSRPRSAGCRRCRARSRGRSPRTRSGRPAWRRRRAPGGPPASLRARACGVSGAERRGGLFEPGIELRQSGLRGATGQRQAACQVGERQDGQGPDQQEPAAATAGRR